MTKEKRLIFRGGKRRGKLYDLERLKKIFSKEAVPAQFIHSTHYEKEKVEPVIIGEFYNFEVEENLNVYADIDLNEKGKQYYKDSIFKNISVEIPKDNLVAVALLPLGVKGAIPGAEFEELLDFEGGRMDTILERLNVLCSEFESQESAETLAVVRLLRKVVEIEEIEETVRQINWISENLDKTEEEIAAEYESTLREKVASEFEEGLREEIKAELVAEFEKEKFEFELQKKKETALADIDSKVPKAFRDAYKLLINQATEFEDKSFDLVAQFQDLKTELLKNNIKETDGEFEEKEKEKGKFSKKSEIMAESMGLKLN